MKTIQFSDLSEISFDLHKVLVIDHGWQNGELWSTPAGGRPDNGLMFLSDCEFEYLDSDGNVTDRAGLHDIVYSPVGAEYTCRFRVPDVRSTVRKPTDLLINFILTDEHGEELRLAESHTTIRTENYRYYLDSFSGISALGRKSVTPPARIKGLLYNLLCDISLEMQQHEMLNKSYAPIYPAIKYLRAADLAELDPSSLAERCHISPSCFRRLFRAYSGMPPLEYVNHLKIAKAKARLQSGEMSVAEVAESLGFSDASYFSRFYKKATGRSPREDLNR